MRLFLGMFIGILSVGSYTSEDHWTTEPCNCSPSTEEELKPSSQWGKGHTSLNEEGRRA